MVYGICCKKAQNLLVVVRLVRGSTQHCFRRKMHHGDHGYSSFERSVVLKTGPVVTLSTSYFILYLRVFPELVGILTMYQTSYSRDLLWS